MKRLRLLTLMCALGATWQIQAQADSSKNTLRAKKWNYEIGLNAYSLTIRGGDFHSNYTNTYDHYAASGFSLKFFHGKSAIRTSADYFQKIIMESVQTMHNRSLSFKTLQFAAGYQRHFGNKRIMPYVFTDLSYGYGREQTRGNYNNDPINFLYYPYNYNNITIRSSTFSATPGVGLRLRLARSLILNLETAAEFFYQKQYVTYTYDQRELTGINLKPVKCSFGFIF